MDQQKKSTKKRVRNEYTYLGSTAAIPKRTKRYWNAKRRALTSACEASASEQTTTNNKQTNKQDDDMKSLENGQLHNVQENASSSQSGKSSQSLSPTSVGESADQKRNKQTDSESREGFSTSGDTSMQQLEEDSPVNENRAAGHQHAHCQSIDDTQDNSAADSCNSFLSDYNIDHLTRSLLIAATKLRHSLTYAATDDISKLLNIETESSNTTTSKYNLKQLIKLCTASMSIHHMCSNCKLYVGAQSNNDIDGNDKNVEILHCHSCHADINAAENVKTGDVFAYMSLKHQLTTMFELSGDRTSYCRDRKKENLYAIEDIFDGRLYKENANDDMISINVSIDGVPIFKSSNYSAHPVLCLVNELHPKHRRGSIMLTGIWCGKGKPKMSEYLKPFVIEAQQLYDEGFDYTFQGRGYNKKCRVIVGVCDSIARPMVRDTVQFNGEFGCGLCLNAGQQVPKGKGTVRVYPLAEDGSAYGEGLRTKDQFLIHAENREKGVKGRSALFDIPGFDVISGLIPDWMHCVPLGVCRQILKLWFDPAYHNKEFYFGEHLNTVDNLVLSYKPTLEVSRTSGKISEYRHLKAHELVVWLLGYSLPTIMRLFPTKYVRHWSLLVEGMSILLKTSIMKSEIRYAQLCLFEFVKGVEDLYGKEHVSFNVHLLTHLPQSVLDWGPLWCHSAFVFEDFNQEIRKCVKSSQGVAIQICDALRLKYTVERLRNICEASLSDRQRTYLYNLLDKKCRPDVSVHVTGADMVGNPFIQRLHRKHFLALHRIEINVAKPDCVQYYKRAYINAELVHTKEYSRVTKRASYTVILKNLEIFEIATFVVFEVNASLHCYAIGKYYEKKTLAFVSGRKLQHITALNHLIPDFAAVHASEIIEKVTIVRNNISDITIAWAHPNHYELLT